MSSADAHSSDVRCLLAALSFVLLGQGLPLVGLSPSCVDVVSVLASIGAAALALCGCIRIIKGRVVRFVCGLIGCFFAVAGFIAFFLCGELLCGFALKGGAAWFAAITMGCCALIGLIFTGVFGYLLLRVMTKGLWLGLAHLCLSIFVLAALVDQHGGRCASLQLPFAAGASIERVFFDDAQGAGDLGFELLLAPVDASPESVLLTLRSDRSCEVQSLDLHEALWHNSWSIALRQLVFDPQGKVAHLDLQYHPGRFLCLSGLFGFLLAVLAWCCMRQSADS